MTPQFKPCNSEYKEKIIESFNRQEVMKTVNASIIGVRPGEMELEFPYHSSLTQQHGFIHAGIVSTVLDTACGYAAFSLMSENAAVLTIEFKVNLLSPTKGECFRAVGKVKKSGKTITVTEGELFSCSDGREKLTATMVATIMSIYDREEIEG
ncbi:PaaI family thioesterase [Desulfococcaceae bacterium HSG7]|nr:PaaI family thioesterase [Desulfococcaceae bacterium HSG7]